MKNKIKKYNKFYSKIQSGKKSGCKFLGIKKTCRKKNIFNGNLLFFL